LNTFIGGDDNDGLMNAFSLVCLMDYLSCGYSLWGSRYLNGGGCLVYAVGEERLGFLVWKGGAKRREGTGLYVKIARIKINEIVLRSNMNTMKFFTLLTGHILGLGTTVVMSLMEVQQHCYPILLPVTYLILLL
jgi:hypothetical protein